MLRQDHVRERHDVLADLVPPRDKGVDGGLHVSQVGVAHGLVDDVLLSGRQAGVYLVRAPPVCGGLGGRVILGFCEDGLVRIVVRGSLGDGRTR